MYMGDNQKPIMLQIVIIINQIYKACLLL